MSSSCISSASGPAGSERLREPESFLTDDRLKALVGNVEGMRRRFDEPHTQAERDATLVRDGEHLAVEVRSDDREGGREFPKSDDRDERREDEVRSESSDNLAAWKPEAAAKDDIEHDAGVDPHERETSEHEVNAVGRTTFNSSEDLPLLRRRFQSETLVADAFVRRFKCKHEGVPAFFQIQDDGFDVHPLGKGEREANVY